MTPRYKLLNIGLNTLIRSSNIVLVKKYNWEVTEDQIPNYLLNYQDEDIKVGQLISSSNNTNEYILSLDGEEKYNLILFVTNTFTVDDSNLMPSTFSSIGAIEIPEIGIGTSETREYISITIEEVDPELDPENITIIKDVSISSEISNYEEIELGKTQSILEESEARSLFPKVSKVCLGTEDAVSFVPGGIVYFNTFFPEQRLNLDLSEFTNVVKTTPIQFMSFEYLRFQDSNGDLVLRSLSEPLADSFIGVVSKSVTTYENVVVLKENIYDVLLNPDFITVTNLVNRSKFRINFNDYVSNGYVRISDVPDNLKENINRFISHGTDLYSNDICTIGSLPGNETWFLQSKFRDIFKNNSLLSQQTINYKVIEHNTKIFILGEVLTNGTVSRKYAADYKGNVINIPSFYFLDIDGYLIVQSSSGWEGYKSNLSPEEKISLNNIYDLYSLIPSGTEMIWNFQQLDFTKIIICRDRFQQI